MSLPNYFISSLNQTLTVGGSDTSIQLATIYTQDGQVVTTADFAQYNRGVITVNPTSLAGVEFISFTGITANTAPLGTLTGCLRGLSFKGNNQIAANQKFNVVGTPVIISFGTHNLLDIPSIAGADTFTGVKTFATGATPLITDAPTTNLQATNKLYVDTQDTYVEGLITTLNGQVVHNTGNEAVAGVKTFSSNITVPLVPVAATDAASKGYVDTGILQGAANASTTVKGISEMSVAPASAVTPIAVGTNDPRVPVAYAVDSIGTDSYAITPSPVITAYAAGQMFSFQAGTANTGAASLNVSGLGAKTIKKDVSSDLATGDILANQIVTIIYDGTNMQMVSSLAGTVNTIPSNPVNYTYTGNNTWTKPAGIKYIIVEVQGGGGGVKGINGGGTTNSGGAGGGGYSKMVILAAALGSTETVTVGGGGSGNYQSGSPTDGGNSSFGTHCYGNGGAQSAGAGNIGAGGSASGGDINIPGQSGGMGTVNGTSAYGGAGGDSVLGFGGQFGTGGAGGQNYGGGGSGEGGSGNQYGAGGAGGIVTLTEFY